MKRQNSFNEIQPQPSSVAKPENEAKFSFSSDFLCVTNDGRLKRLSFEFAFDTFSRKVRRIDLIVDAQTNDQRKAIIRKPKFALLRKSINESKQKGNLPPAEMDKIIKAVINDYNANLESNTKIIKTQNKF